MGRNRVSILPLETHLAVNAHDGPLEGEGHSSRVHTADHAVAQHPVRIRVRCERAVDRDVHLCSGGKQACSNVKKASDVDPLMGKLPHSISWLRHSRFVP